LAALAAGSAGVGYSCARQHPAMWSSTIPADCMSAYIVVGPTNVKPSRRSSLLIAVDSAVTAATSAHDCARV
jgi:hypothetical protein